MAPCLPPLIFLLVQNRKVELKTRKDTTDPSALQKSADFVSAFVLGFSIKDAIALLRLDDLYIESFEIKVRAPVTRDCGGV